MTTTTPSSVPTQDGLAARLHNEHVDRLIAEGHVPSDPGDPLHRAFRSVPLHEYVGWFFKQQFLNVPGVVVSEDDEARQEALRDLYTGISWPTILGEDGPISCILPGVLAAEMIAVLNPQPGDRVLVIGGDTTVLLPALLAEVTGEKVTTVEPHTQIVASARATIERLGAQDRIELVETNGYDIPTGPWQRIVTAHGCPGLPAPWLTELADNGVVLLPVAAAGEYGVVRVTHNSETGQPVGHGVRWRDGIPGHGALAHVQERRLDMDEQGPFTFIDEPAVVHKFDPPLDARTYTGLHAFVLVSEGRAGYRLINGHDDISCAICDPNGYTAAFGPEAVLVGATEPTPDEPSHKELDALTSKATQLATTFEALGRPHFGDWSCNFTPRNLDQGRFWVPGQWTIEGPSGTHVLPA